MKSRFTSQNLQAVLTFPFQDEKWVSKFAVFILLSFASILIFPAFFISGYYYEIMRRIIQEGQDPSLPDWDDMGDYFKNGMKMFGVSVIYTLPSILCILPTIALFLSVGLIEPSSENASGVLIAFPITTILIMVGSGVGLVMGILSPVAIGHMVATDSFKAAFQVREWWSIFKVNFGGYILAYIIVMGISMATSFVMQFLMMTVVLCIVIPILLPVVFAYNGVISNVLYAQAYMDGVSFEPEESSNKKNYISRGKTPKGKQA